MSDRPTRAFRFLPTPSQAPATYIYLTVLVITTSVQLVVSNSTRHALLSGSSTDVHHLRHQPLLVLLLSAFWLSDTTTLLLLPLGIIVLGVAERRFGALRTLIVFLAGHVLATLLTETSVALAVHLDWVGVAHERQVDVGPSYGAFAVVGGLIVTLSSQWVRPALVAIALLVVLAFTVDPEVSTAGHAIAVIVGAVVALNPWIRGPGLGTQGDLSGTPADGGSDSNV
jgi:hypothetical protein